MERRNHNRRQYQHPRANEDVKKLFQATHKSMLINADSVIDITSNDVSLYQVSNLLELENKLNATKSKLDPLYLESSKNKTFSNLWLQFNNIIDLYKPMRFRIEKTYNALHVTNAWMKYWEIYSQYNIIPTQTDHEFKAFFNAELPGAALCAFNHYMKTMRSDISFDWRASSLAPATGNSIEALGDAYGLYSMNKDKWLMTIETDPSGRNNNGDATMVENLEDFATQVGPNSPWGGVDLYSHDAGIDVSSDFNAQEMANAKVHLGCALAGLMTLRPKSATYPGGVFIAKQYTFFKTFTWNLILIYASMFDEFYICKPLTSRPYNSEIYLVGKGFRGLPEEIKSLLITRLKNFNTSPFIPEDAVKIKLRDQLSAVVSFANDIFWQQIQFINENISLFKKYKPRLNNLRDSIKQLDNRVINEWLTVYKLGKINDEDQLPSF